MTQYLRRQQMFKQARAAVAIGGWLIAILVL